MKRGIRIAADIMSKELVDQIDAICKERGIHRTDFLREAVELHVIPGSRVMYLSEQRDRLKRRLAIDMKIRETQDEEITDANKAIEQQKSEITALEYQLKREKENSDKLIGELNDELHNAEDDLVVANEEKASFEERYNVVVEHRDVALRMRDTYKQKFEEAVSAIEQLIAKVRHAQDGLLLTRGSRVKQINLAEYQVKAENGTSETSESTTPVEDEVVDD